MSRRWRRNQRLKCICGGYHFPHRRAGGACHTSRTRVYHEAKRRGMDHDEALLELAWQTGGRLAVECPF